MKQGWNDYERAAEKGPLSLLVKVFLGVAVLVALGWGISTVFGLFAETTQVAHDEFGPKAALQKYEWFKDTSAALDQKRATIGVFQTRLKHAQKRDDEHPSDNNDEAVTQAESELDGVISSYNNLAAQYNAQMKKFNWRFANRGGLPEGAAQPLPREYKPYISK